ncbi:MAG: hypothetical protein PHF33_09140 [Candidatus Delongbacteria bacterium]|nr:hypothetical protein [Candidatus Delongbacteria bacterium]MDD4206123.1 hypothetical protein [Candidatus Delongbacteria bacterium]
MKKEIPILLGLIVGILWYGEFFIAGMFQENQKLFFANGMKIAGVIGIMVGVYSVARQNYYKIKYNNERYYAILRVFMIFLMIFLGITSGTSPGTPFSSMFMSVYVPFQATVFSLLAFYIASAAYRSFKAKSVESGVLLAASIIVMLSKIPIGQEIWSQIPVMGEWIMDAPSSAGRRAIIFGGYLGSITMMIRIFFGLERSHLSE